MSLFCSKTPPSVEKRGLCCLVMPNKQAHLSATNENTDINEWAEKGLICLFVLLYKLSAKASQ